MVEIERSTFLPRLLYLYMVMYVRVTRMLAAHTNTIMLREVVKVKLCANSKIISIFSNRNTKIVVSVEDVFYM